VVVRVSADLSAKIGLAFSIAAWAAGMKLCSGSGEGCEYCELALPCRLLFLGRYLKLPAGCGCGVDKRDRLQK
jgi:hypothetical protein